MKTLKLKKKILIVLLVICTLSIFLFATSLSRKTVKADVTTVTDCEDRFSDGEVSDSWTMINETGADVEFLDVTCDALLFSADFNAYLNQVCYKSYTMTGPCRVEFTTLCEGSSGYIAFSAGNKNPALGMPYSSAAFIMAPTYAHIFANDGGAIAVVEKHVQYYSPLMEKYYGQQMKTTFDFQGTGEKDFYNIVYTVETMDGQRIGSYTYENIFIENGYLGFNSEYSRVGVTSFKVYEGEEEKVNCDFKEASILYPSSGSRDSDWVACGFDESSLVIGAMATLNVSKVGTSAVYNAKYERPKTTELEELFSLSVDVKTSEMGVGVATGFEIGKSALDAAGTFAGLTKNDEGEYFLVTFDGVKQNKVPVDAAEVDGLTMHLNVYYDNTAILSIGDASLAFSCKVVEGYFALTTVDFYNCFENEVGAKLDNFIYKHNTYQNVQSSDMSINFEGTKKTYHESVDAEFTNYYINKKDWRISDDVIIPMYFGGVENNAITFTGLTANSSFGPNYKYTNFIVRFDVTVLESAELTAQPMFGLQFGMADTTSTVAQSAFFGFQSFLQQSYVTAQNAKLSTGNYNEPLSADAFSVEQENIFQEGKSYNVMYVAQNGTVKLYLKEQSQPDSVLEMLRGEIKGVNTQGYLQVLAMNRAKFQMDNFSVTNLDYNMSSSEYNGNGYEMLRSDFSMGDKLYNFALSKTEYKDTSLLIKKGGYVRSAETVKNQIVRFKTKATGGDVIFEQGELEVRFAASGDKILVASNKMVNEFYLDEKIDFDGALIEIFKMGNAVTVRYVNQNQPVSCIRNHQYEVVADNIFEDSVKLYASDGSLELYSLSLFDLKPSITIATRNYDEALDYIDPWSERPSIQEINGEGGSGLLGCSASVASSAVVLPVALALALVFVLRRRKDEKNQ